MSTTAASGRNYVVTAIDRRGKNVVKSEVWNPQRPLGIGHPVQWVLEKAGEGVRIRNIASAANEVVDSNCEEYSFETLEKDPEISLSRFVIRIEAIPTLAEIVDRKKSFTPRLVASEYVAEKSSDLYFLKALGITAVLVVFSALRVHFFKEKPRDAAELIPPQFTKLLLSPAFKKETTGDNQAMGSGAQGQEKNLEVALRSEAVQKSSEKLLKKGAMSLLAQSDLLGSAVSKAAVSTIFDAKSNFTHSALKMDAMTPEAIKVKTLGGAGGAIKNGVGYAKGNVASLSNQGAAFVSLDTREAVVEEGLTADEVGKVIHSHLSEIRYCYESAMIRNPGLEGKLAIDFTIRSSGVVKGAHVKTSTLGDPNLDQCILSHLLTWVYPKPKGGIDVDVSYPFIFKTLGK